MLELAKNDEEKELEEVLSSIKDLINESDLTEEKKNNIADTKDLEVFELTDVVCNSSQNTIDGMTKIISNNTENQVVSELKKLKQIQIDIEAEKQQIGLLDSKVLEIMHPLIKVWLENNLPKIVKKIVLEEIQKVIKKI